MCPHSPPCPHASAADREAAHTVASHPEQGWSLLCNGVIIFEDTGELLPGGQTVAPHRPTDMWAWPVDLLMTEQSRSAASHVSAA
jgi:uncharacterized protein DUF5999